MGLLDEPTEGNYVLDGKEAGELTEAMRAHARLKKVGFVFQMFNLLPRSSALENVILPIIYAERDASLREKRARELLKRVGMEDRVDHLPSELSGGQMQRVAIARALANKPTVLFADEPTGNLDSKSGEQILDLLKELHKDGTTIVLVTHEAPIAAAAQRIITLLDGRVVSDSGAKKQRAPAKNKKTPARKTAKTKRKTTAKTTRKRTTKAAK